MFQEVIRQTPLTGNAADSVFTQVNGDPYRDDVSFLATLRMILHGRMPAEDSLYFWSHRSDRGTHRFRDGSAQNDIECAIGCDVNDIEGNRLILTYLELYSDEDRKNVMEFIDKHFVECFPEWEKNQRVTDLFRAQFRTLCFFNKELKSSIVFVERMDYRIYHLIQTAIGGFLPWYFGKEMGNKEEILELLYSMREKTSEKYLAVLRKFADKFDFRSERIKSSLDGFELVALKSRLQNVEQKIDEIMRNIRDYNSQIVRLMQQKFEFDIQYTGIQTKLSSGETDNELMSYFLSNKALVLSSVNGSRLIFGVKTYLEFYDEDTAKAVIQNPHSYVYACQTGSITREDMKKLMTAIFIDNVFKIRMCSAYYIDLTGGYECIARFRYDSEFDGYLPNPHINRYGCIGNYAIEIGECMKRNDYVMAIEQCAASCRSLNFNDSPVMNEFMNNMYTYGRQTGFIEAPDGELLKPAQAIEWLRSHEKGE